MQLILRASIVAAATLVLAGCLLPEKFNASVSVRPDGTYNFKYQGTGVHMLSAQEIKRNGSLSAKSDEYAKKDISRFANDPGVKKLIYKGAGRYDVSIDSDLKIESDLKPGQKPRILNIVSLSKSKDGVFTLSTPPLKKGDRNDLVNIGVKVSGLLEVSLPPNAKVLQHNANGSPGLFSKVYSWKISGYDTEPILTFKLN